MEPSTPLSVAVGGDNADGWLPRGLACLRSGGIVALPRTEPKILLMDEPLSNLDARLREQMRVELKKITKAIGVTTLYVTHDQAEALSLGDNVCVMNNGDILQVGPPSDMYSRPTSLFVAQFVGEMNFIKGKITQDGMADSAIGKLRCPVPPDCQAGKEVTLAIRPEHLIIQPTADQKSQCVDGTITSKTYLGDTALYEVEVSGVTLTVKLPGDSDLAVGHRAVVVLPEKHWHVYT